MSEAKHPTIWVLMWRYYDGSGYGLVRAYDTRARAEDDLELMKSDPAPGAEWTITELRLYPE